MRTDSSVGMKVEVTLRRNGTIIGVRKHPAEETKEDLQQALIDKLKLLHRGKRIWTI